MGASRLAFIELQTWCEAMFNNDPWALDRLKKQVALLKEKYDLYGLCSCDERCKLHGKASLDMFTENNYKMLRNLLDYFERDIDTHLRLDKCESKLLTNLLKRIRTMKMLYKENER